eukprot:1158892-Pelagomonas_calceolata.AAC.2
MEGQVQVVEVLEHLECDAADGALGDLQKMCITSHKPLHSYLHFNAEICRGQIWHHKQLLCSQVKNNQGTLTTLFGQTTSRACHQQLGMEGLGMET